MAFVTNVVAPFLKILLLGGFIFAWIIGSIYLILKYVLTKRRRLWIKFHIFKKKYNEEIVKWCLDAYDKGYRKEFEVKKILLMKGEFSLKKVEEILFIFSEIDKMKGGIESHGRIRQSSREIEFPKIQERSSEEKAKGRRN
jgi:hypothetical protein